MHKISFFFKNKNIKKWKCWGLWASFSPQGILDFGAYMIADSLALGFFGLLKYGLGSSFVGLHKSTALPVEKIHTVANIFCYILRCWYVENSFYL